MPKMAVGASLVLGALEKMVAADDDQKPQPVGLPKKPAAVKVGFLRPRGSEGGAWPGHGYNFDTWCAEYTSKLRKMGKDLGMNIVIGSDAMLYDGDPLTKFIEATKKEKPDALLLAPIGIFGRWKRAGQILEAVGGIPTLIFSPIGGSFSLDTKPFAKRPGCWLMTSNDINDVRDGLEMVKAATILKQSVVVFLSGTERKEVVYGKLGTVRVHSTTLGGPRLAGEGQVEGAGRAALPVGGPVA